MHDAVKIFRNQATTSTDKQYIIVQRFTITNASKIKAKFLARTPEEIQAYS
tara:strand:- start:258 stop:410 length:153 start_codon:yes stop_codon:yes gene_type:complete